MPAQTAAPQRVVSMTLCADELVLWLAAPGTVRSVTWLARESSISTVARQASDVPVNCGLVEEIVPLQPDLSVDWRDGGLTLGGALKAFGERYDNASNTIRLGGYTTLDLCTEWSLARDWAVAARLKNALGKRYETVYGDNQPEREAYLALRWSPR